MYFDYRLWQLDSGHARAHGGRRRARPAGSWPRASLRYVFLGQMLARVFAGDPWQRWAGPAGAAIVMVLLRGSAAITGARCRPIVAPRRVQQALRGSAVRPHRGAGACLVRQSAHRRRDADGGGRRRAAAGLLRAVPAPGRRRGGGALAIFAVIAFCGRAHRPGVLLAAALFALFGPMAVTCWTGAPAWPVRNRLQLSARSSWTRCRAAHPQGLRPGKSWGRQLQLARARAACRTAPCGCCRSACSRAASATWASRWALRWR